MKRIILILSISLFFKSCQFIHYNDNKSLGDGYYYVYDKPSSIIYSEEDNNGKSGTLVIPSSIEVETDYGSSVANYDFNERYIIAKTKDEKQSIKYWILDKSNYKIEVPLKGMDSINFYRELTNKSINLNFK